MTQGIGRSPLPLEHYRVDDIDRAAIAYYRYERIVADLVAYGERVLRRQGSAEDREVAILKVASAFLPNNVVEAAHKSFAELH